MSFLGAGRWGRGLLMMGRGCDWVGPIWEREFGGMIYLRKVIGSGVLAPDVIILRR